MVVPRISILQPRLLFPSRDKRIVSDVVLQHNMTTLMAPTMDGIVHGYSAEADFYKKLAQLRDEVTTGRHPRYKFPALHEVQLNGSTATVSNRQSTSTSQQRAPTTERVDIATAAPLFRAPSQDVTNGLFQTGLLGHTNTMRTFLKFNGSATDAASNRVTFRNSDMNKAKAASKGEEQDISKQRARRHQIERVIKDKVARENVNARAKGMEDLLERGVLASIAARSAPRSGFIVTPPPTDRKLATAGSDLSYYSSRGASWTPELDRRAEGNLTDHAIVPTEHAMPRQSNARSKVSGLGPNGTFIPGLSANVTAPLLNHSPDVPAQVADDTFANQMEIDDVREESYSPPAANAFRSFGAIQRADQRESEMTCGVPDAAVVMSSNHSPSHSVYADVESESDYSPPPPATAVPAFGSLANDVQALTAPVVHKKVKPLSRKQQRKQQRAAQAAALAAETAQERQQAKEERRRERKEAKANRRKQQQQQDGAIAPSQGPNVSQTHATNLPSARTRGEPKRARRAAEQAAAVATSNHSSTRISQIKQESITPPSFREQDTESRRVVLNDDGTVSIVTVAAQQGNLPLAVSSRTRSKKAAKNSASKSARADSDYVDSPDSDSSPRTGLRRDKANLRKLASMQNASRPQPHLRHVSIPDTWSQHGRNLAEEFDHRRPILDDEAQTFRPASRMSTVQTNQLMPQHYAYQPHSGQTAEHFNAPSPRAGVMPPPPPPPTQTILRDEHGNEYIAIPRMPEGAQPAQAYAQQTPATSDAYLQQAVLPHLVDLTQSYSPATHRGHTRTPSRYDPELTKRQRLTVGYTPTAPYTSQLHQNTAPTAYSQAQPTLVENSYMPNVIDLEKEGSEHHRMMPPPLIPARHRSQNVGSVKGTPALLPQPVPQSSQLHHILTMPSPTPLGHSTQYDQAQLGQPRSSHHPLPTHSHVIDLEEEGSEYRPLPRQNNVQSQYNNVPASYRTSPNDFEQDDRDYNPKHPSMTPSMNSRILVPGSVRMQAASLPHLQQQGYGSQAPSTQALPFVYPTSAAQYQQPRSGYDQQQHRFPPPPPPPPQWPSQATAFGNTMPPPPPPPPAFLANWLSLPANPNGLGTGGPSRPPSAFGTSQWGGYGQR